MKKHKTLPAGFTILEMAIVITIGGVLLVAGAIMLRNYLLESRMFTTQSRMLDIDNALIQYVNVNGVLPCVASLTAAESSAAYGQPITAAISPAPGYCSGAAGGGSFAPGGEVPGALGAPKDTRTVTTNTTGTVVVGAVPVRALGLPDEDMTDAWGDRFVYAVTDALTFPGNATSPSTYDPSQGSITVQDATGADVAVPSGSAQYVLVSYGADRAGAYTIAGAASGTACPTGAVETPNCALPPAGKMTFVKTTQNSSSNLTGAGLYDDYVTFHNLLLSTGILPSGIVAPFTQITCPAGWGSPTAAGAAACSPGSSYICCQKN